MLDQVRQFYDRTIERIGPTSALDAAMRHLERVWEDAFRSPRGVFIGKVPRQSKEELAIREKLAETWCETMDAIESAAALQERYDQAGATLTRIERAVVKELSRLPPEIRNAICDEVQSCISGMRLRSAEELHYEQLGYRHARAMGAVRFLGCGYIFRPDDPNWLDDITLGRKPVSPQLL